MTVPGWERAACAQRSCIVHTTQTKRGKTPTQDQHILGEHTAIPVPTQPVESCPTGRPRAPACPPAMGRWDTHTASLQMPSWALRQTLQKTNNITSLLDLRSADTESGKGRRHNTQTPGHWRQVVMREGPHPSRIFHSSPLFYKNSSSQSLSSQG